MRYLRLLNEGKVLKVTSLEAFETVLSELKDYGVRWRSGDNIEIGTIDNELIMMIHETLYLQFCIGKNWYTSDEMKNILTYESEPTDESGTEKHEIVEVVLE